MRCDASRDAELIKTALSDSTYKVRRQPLLQPAAARLRVADASLATGRFASRILSVASPPLLSILHAYTSAAAAIAKNLIVTRHITLC